ncbi:uncharacterized protein N7515_001996 [Penicillium bovifimosum]|uniref:Uncharacterized protein n=1 Tax=Penicillium bovifimosum TaxID=126998 RepID=A0A9W9HB27_9EURO|nr:uncharacterized protein N7515_001996 [Penicillium bovifimosum]KAJ5143209.1 hypothetical protein N7515_001996 [Penicillium bovifimosum]
MTEHLRNTDTKEMSKSSPVHFATGDAMSTTTGNEALDTPTGTSVSDESTDTSVCSESIRRMILSQYRERRSWNCPWPGRTFIIRDPVTKLVLGLEKGILRLVPEDDGQGRSIHWCCVRHPRGLWGLQNNVSGTYVGTWDMHQQKEFVARSTTHNSTESLFVQGHPDGGYIISVVTDKTRVLSMESRQEELLAVTSNTATAWKFVRVDLSD